MPKNQKAKKNSAKRAVSEKRELLLKQDVKDTEYGLVIKALGECNFQVKCFDNVDRLCHVRKSIKRNFVQVDSVVLIGTRDYQVEKGDIVYVYTYEEATKLKNMGEIHWSLTADHAADEDDEDGDEKDDDVHFDFEEI